MKLTFFQKDRFNRYSAHRSLRLIAAVCMLASCAGCQAAVTRLKPALQNEGEVFLYLQPLPPDGGRLAFTIDRLAAVSSDGLEVPLTVKVPEIGSGEINRQRLIAEGVLPPGDYDGFAVIFKGAHLKSAGGTAALLLPEKPVRIDSRFTVGSRRGVLLNLTFGYDRAVRDGYAFTPSFSADLPGRPLAGLAGYVTNRGSDNITVFDKKSGEAVEVISTGRGPAGIALDQLQQKAYVALSGEDAVEVIDLYAEYGFRKIRLNPGDDPRDVALSPNGKTLVVTNPGSNTVSIVDAAALIEIGRLSVGKGPGFPLFDPSGQRAYVFNTLSDTVSVIDVGYRRIVATIATESTPLRGQFSRRGERLVVSHELSPYLLEIDPKSMTVQKRVFVSMGIGALKTDPLNDLLYVGRKHEGRIETFDPFSLLPGGFFDSTGGTSWLAVDGELNNLLLLHGERKSLEIINLISKRRVSEIDVGDDPFQVVVRGER